MNGHRVVIDEPRPAGLRHSSGRFATAIPHRVVVDEARGVTEIHLSGGHVALIDSEDAAVALATRWHAYKHGRTWYARGNNKRGETPSTLFLHRTVLRAAPGTIVDHINHDGLDCRKGNLRFATSAQQNANRLKPVIFTTSRFRGVHAWRDKGGVIRWRAGVQSRGVQRRVSCATEIDAARAYNALASEAFSEFALLNEVP